MIGVWSGKINREAIRKSSDVSSKDSGPTIGGDEIGKCRGFNLSQLQGDVSGTPASKVCATEELQGVDIFAIQAFEHVGRINHLVYLVSIGPCTIDRQVGV